jgi:hypothetical protein
MNCKQQLTFWGSWVNDLHSSGVQMTDDGQITLVGTTTGQDGRNDDLLW